MGIIGSTLWSVGKKILMAELDLPYEERTSRREADRTETIESKTDSLLGRFRKDKTYTEQSFKPMSGSVTQTVAKQDAQLKRIIYTPSQIRDVRISQLNLSDVSYVSPIIDRNFKDIANQFTLITKVLADKTDEMRQLEKSINDKIYNSFQVEAKTNTDVAKQLDGQVSKINTEVREFADRMDVHDSQIDDLKHDLNSTKREIEKLRSANFLGKRPTDKATPPPLPKGAQDGEDDGLLGKAIDAIKTPEGKGGLALLIAKFFPGAAAAAATFGGAYLLKNFFDKQFGVDKNPEMFADLIKKRDAKAAEATLTDQKTSGAVDLSVQTLRIESAQTMIFKAKKITFDAEEIVYLNGTPIKSDKKSEAEPLKGDTAPSPTSTTELKVPTSNAEMKAAAGPQSPMITQEKTPTMWERVKNFFGGGVNGGTGARGGSGPIGGPSFSGGGGGGSGVGGGSGGYTPGPIAGGGNYTPTGEGVGMSGKNRVDSISLYTKLKEKYAKSKLNGYVPPDGAKFGVINGTPEEWARFGVAVAKQESGFNVQTANLSDPGGSFGLYQYAHGQVPGGNAYNADASIDAFVRDTESYANPEKNGSIGNMRARFGSIRRPHETTQHLGWVDKNVVEAANKEAPKATQETPATPPPPEPPKSVTDAINQANQRSEGVSAKDKLGQSREVDKAVLDKIKGVNQSSSGGRSAAEKLKGSADAPVGGQSAPSTNPKMRGRLPAGLHPAIKDSMLEASKYLPEGYSFKFNNAARNSSTVSKSYHLMRDSEGHALATDISIIGPDGKELKNIRSPQNFGLYRDFMQNTKKAMMDNHPELAGKGRWGGYFVSGVPQDLMHYDLGPEMQTAAGDWLRGLDPRYAHFGRPEDVGKGMGDFQNYKMIGTPNGEVTTTSTPQAVPGPAGPGGGLALKDRGITTFAGMYKNVLGNHKAQKEGGNYLNDKLPKVAQPSGRDSYRQPMAPKPLEGPLAGMSGIAGKLPGAKPSPRQGPKMPMASVPRQNSTGLGRTSTRDKNPVQERVKTLSPYEAAQGARGGAMPGGGINSDRRTKRMTPEESTSEARKIMTDGSKGTDTRGDTSIQSPRHKSPYDSNPPAPGDDGTGNYDTSCFV